MLTTTLTAVWKDAPLGRKRWKHLLEGLGVTEADEAPLPLERILDINGLDDALWALRSLEAYNRAARLFACNCAKLALPVFERAYPEDKRPRMAVETAELFAQGETTAEKLADAEKAAEAAVNAAEQAKARESVRLAAKSAACAAQRDIEFGAAWAAENAARAMDDAVDAAAWSREKSAAWTALIGEFRLLCRLGGPYSAILAKKAGVSADA